ncbi:PGN_0703 family putative restriction endonuclease [Brevibacillus sp. B_LB10_24]|uniref:PGN_0703 family putative restriction endonuclease n=1 Tax=Brevibacillus sp. B_LB10_24 TaxID=3380645 RepID=UPI0038B943FB
MALSEGREYSHILPKELFRLNILDPYRDQFFNDPIAEEIKFHQFFHHVNSSQAVCINYYYPFITEGKLEWIAEIFGCQDRVSEWAFEKVVDKAEQTNFDFYMKATGGKQLFFEVKYTEQEFGTAKNDESHQRKYHLIYSRRLKGKVKKCSMEDFFRHYQILRNISYLEIDSKDEL